jgi:thiol-disulfide isomerase/thioredoxin
MKIYNYYLFLCLIFLFSCGEKSSETPFISGSSIYQIISKAPSQGITPTNTDIEAEIEGMPDGTAYLFGSYTGNYYRVATAPAKNGRVRFERDTFSLPGLYFIVFPDQQTRLQILLDQDQEFKITSNTQDLIGMTEVEGSLDNELLYETLRFEDDLRSEYKRINDGLSQYKVGTPEHNQLIIDQKAINDKKQEFLTAIFKKHPKTLFSAFKEAGQNPNLLFDFNADGSLSPAYLIEYRERYWENVNFKDKRLLRTPVVSNKLEKYFTNLIPQNQDSIIFYAEKLMNSVLDQKDYFAYFANWITLKYEPTKTTLMDPEAVYVFMVQNYFTRERAFWTDSMQIYGLQLRAQEMAGSLVGNKGPDVQAKDEKGKMRSIYEIEEEYIVVYMWNPTCEHCQEQTPKLVELYKEWHPKGMEVFSIVVNSEDQAWKNAIKKYKMPWINVNDPSNRSIYGKYYVDITPEIYLLNKERIIIGKNLNVEQIPIVIERDKNR